MFEKRDWADKGEWLYSKTEEDLQKWKDDDKISLMLTGIRPTGKACVLEVFCEYCFDRYEMNFY